MLSRSTPSHLLPACAAMLLALLSSAFAREAHALISYSGHGIGVYAVVANGQPQTIADTGELPATGGSLQDSVVLAEIPGLLSAAVVEAETSGAGNSSQTSAAITDLAIGLPGLGITVDLLQSEAMASCSGTTPSVGGSSIVAELAINGQGITILGTPNQVVQLPLGLGQLIINEQTSSGIGSTAAIEVNALRLLVPSLGVDVKLASSHADVDCDATNGCVAPPLFSGRATVVDATVLGVHNALVDSGALPPEGGMLQSSLAIASLPGLLAAEELLATTSGSGNQSMSEATVSSLDLSVAGIGITAEVVTSMAEAACTPNGPTADGDSVVLALVVAGTPIVIDGTPNQTIPLPLGLGQIVINEQVGTITASTAEINVAALRIVVTGVADIAISKTHADVTCEVPDRIYGGQGIIAQVQTTIPPISNTIGDTGALPSQGGMLSSSLPSINLPGILTAQLVQSTASAAGNQSEAETQLANVNVLASLVTAQVIGSTATASCDGTSASATSSSQIANLSIAGTPIVVSGQPNQTINLIGGTLTLNETTSVVNGSEAQITVNAVHLSLAGVANIVLGSSHAKIDCDPNPSPPCPPAPTPTPTPAPTQSPTPPPPTPTPTPTAAPPTPAPTPTTSVCNHNCPDKIRLKNGIDALMVKSGFAPTTLLDPPNEAFTIVVRNANGIVYQASLLPGDLVKRGSRFEFRDRLARRGQGIRGGLSRVQIAPVPDGRGTRVIVDAFGDLSAATLSVMTVDITLGNDRIAYTQPWEQKSYGWFLLHR